MIDTTFITPSTWIVSDTHFFHRNIGRYCNRPGNWQDLIIKNWNTLISRDETILHLGDFAFGAKSNFDWLMATLPGRLFLIQGNHDRISSDFCESRGVTLIKEPVSIELGEKKIIFSHRPFFPLDHGWINLHGHIHDKQIDPPSPYHLNMSVEVREYKPWRLGDVLNKNTP